MFSTDDISHRSTFSTAARDRKGILICVEQSILYLSGSATQRPFKCSEGFPTLEDDSSLGVAYPDELN